jgi:hypothetical protein
LCFTESRTRARSFPTLETIELFEPVHPEFAQAIRVLGALGLPYAELWRMLRPVARRLDLPRPSYPTVRRLAIAERRRKTRRQKEVDEVLARVLRGFPPFPNS